MSYPVTFYPCDGSQVRVVYEEEPTDPELDSAAGRIAYELDCAPEDVRVWKEWCEPYRDPRGWWTRLFGKLRLLWSGSDA